MALLLYAFSISGFELKLLSVILFMNRALRCIYLGRNPARGRSRRAAAARQPGRAAVYNYLRSRQFEGSLLGVVRAVNM